MRTRPFIGFIILLYACLWALGCSEEDSQTEPPTSTLEDASGDSTPDTIQDADTAADQETSATCGDGALDDGEECDDGNTINDDACDNRCRLSSCGDGVLQDGEACDDGPNNSDSRPDACRVNCTLARCGDSVTDDGEACDDANNVVSDSCIDCVAARCGDGIIRQNVETCDDQNASSLDGCSDQCRAELGFDCQNEPSVCVTTCGDGVVGGLETCDDQNTLDSDYCSADCSAITGRCGDNIIQSNEACDDGNTNNGDDCAANCQSISGFCGDGRTQANEVCDDANSLPGDYCAADCQAITGACGDGLKQDNETCDDANSLPGDYCAPNCLQITGACGDGLTQTNEACDDANTANGDHCASDCLSVTGRCGDGILQTNEACDDANLTVGDYCSTLCTITGFCGDGTIQAPAGEVCDDANTQNNDGCDSACATLEPGWNCFPGSPTSCSPILCLANQRVQNNACVFCALGTENAAGDDASGPNTACDPTLCAADEYVQANACVACGFGSTNAPGDDASGIDTTCDVDPCYNALDVLCSDFEQAYIKASAPGWSDQFGYAVAIEGDTLVVGAPQEGSNATGINGDQTNNSASGSGAVYVFTRAGSSWSQQAYIKASNTGSMDSFGDSLALSGDTLAVGAYQEDSSAVGINGDQTNNSASGSGAVYVFTRTNSTWTQQAYVKASNPGVGDSFGSAISLSGDTLAVGAPEEDSNATGINGNQADNSADLSGAVYVFTRSGTTWTQQAYIKASNSQMFDTFGISVALSGDTLAVGARSEASSATGVNGDQTNNSASGSGAVYVFTRAGSSWSQQAYIKASNTGSSDDFGISLALSGDTLAVGAISEDGSAVGINGDQASNASTDSGAVYIFARAGTTWTQQAYVKASNPDVGDSFGWAISLSGDTLAVGARNEDSDATGVDGDQADDSILSSGAVYVFRREGTSWEQLAYIKSSNTNADDQFGFAVALSGASLAVGAPFEDSSAAGVNGDQANNSLLNGGAVYVRLLEHSLCAENQHVQSLACVDCPIGMTNVAGDDPYSADTSCDVDPCYAVVGVLCADFEQAYIKSSNTESLDNFGGVVSLSGDTLAVSARNEDSIASGINGNQADNSASNSGAVYVFTRSGTAWAQQAYIKASNSQSADSFGISIALSGDTLAVGATGEDSNATGINGNQADNSASDSGAVYVFTRVGSSWSQEAYIKASNAGGGDIFGTSVALSGNTLAVGAPGEDSSVTGVNGNQADNSAFNSGAVYVFTRSGTNWSQQAYIKASNTEAPDRFGTSITLDVDTLAVGALNESSNATGVNGNQADNSASNSGAVYVFTRSGTAWSQQAYIKASNTGSTDSFGYLVSLSGDTLAVCAYSEASSATGVNGNQADNSAFNSGAVYVFTRSGTTWFQQAYVKASNSTANDRFGSSVSVFGDTLAVGAILEDGSATSLNGDQADNSAINSGAVYIYTRSGTTWTQQAYVKASNTELQDEFGSSVSLSGDTLAVGAWKEGSGAISINGDQTDNSASGSGAVYIRKIAP